jgi:hypothetical protein
MKRKALDLFVNTMNGKISQGVEKFNAWNQSIDKIFTLTESTVDFELVTRYVKFLFVVGVTEHVPPDLRSSVLHTNSTKMSLFAR